ncbi:DNA-binding protein [Chroococcidiopsis cubana]|nr:DNA-binding protein [Chroococcidiopsis cubana]
MDKAWLLGTGVIFFTCIISIPRFPDARPLSLTLARVQLQMKLWYSPSELAGLPGMPVARSNVTRKARSGGWQSRARHARGGGREYACSSLPEDTQAALLQIDSTAKDWESKYNPAPFDRKGDERESQPQQLAAIERIQNCVLEGRSPTTTSKTLKTTVSSNSIAQRADAWLEILRTFETWSESQNFATAVERDLEFVRAYNLKQLSIVNSNLGSQLYSYD